jgi:hypothetical protein
MAPLPVWLPPPLRAALLRLQLAWPPTAEALRRAYRRLALPHHPDRGGEPKDFIATKDAHDRVAEALAHGLPQPPPPPGPEPEPWSDAWDEFRAGFRPSRAGNLWQKWDDLVVTVFRRAGRFHWCIDDCTDRPRFSRGAGWRTRGDAMRDLWEALDDYGVDRRW